jgi:hypothetical protein
MLCNDAKKAKTLFFELYGAILSISKGQVKAKFVRGILSVVTTLHTFQNTHLLPFLVPL